MVGTHGAKEPRGDYLGGRAEVVEYFFGGRAEKMVYKQWVQVEVMIFCRLISIFHDA